MSVDRIIQSVPHCEPRSSVLVVGTFTHLRKATVSLSVRRHGASRLRLNGFSWNVNLSTFRKICQEISSFIKNLTRSCNECFTWRTVWLSDHISASSSYSEKCFRRKCRESQNTTFTFFPENRSVYEIMRRNMGRGTDHRWQYHKAHEHYVAGK